jgi:hypothetical protein
VTPSTRRCLPPDQRIGWRVQSGSGSVRRACKVG